MISVTDDEILAIYHRHAQERFAADDPRWKELVEAQRRKQGKRRLKQAVLGAVSSRYDRTQEKVRDTYEESWGATSAVDMVNATDVDLCEWRGEGALVRAPATPAVHHLLLTRTLEALQPKTVLEVGCGSGLHVMLLATLFPDAKFHGAELTAAGVRQAEKIQALPRLPQELQEFAAQPVVDATAHRNVEFRQTSAVDLPYEDGSFDLVYTSLALEQMEEIRDAAFASVARVARRHVAMVEPFRDFNEEGIRNDYVRSRGFLAAHVADLPRYGLKPVYTRSDIPCKVALGVGLVIAEKAG